MKAELLSRLAEIVGSDYVSDRPEELYLYSRDPGAQPPRKVDGVVMPRTVDEVQRIVALANREKLALTPMGAGLTLSALTIPLKGGIVLDMKRMDGIIEVNEASRYAVIEAGVTQAALGAYLEKHYPHLQHSTPESPPTATIVGNILIHGHGHLTPRYGVNSQMVNGMEVVLPTGEVCRLGSGSVSPNWFSRDPLPDLMGLFLGWLGTTGIVTKLSLQLFPKPAFRDLLLFVSDSVELIPELIAEFSQINLLENCFIITQEKPRWAQRIYYIIVVSGESQEEFEVKKELHERIFRKYRDKVEPVSEEKALTSLRERFLGVPPFAATAADFRKGGGFEYTGAILPIEVIPEAWRSGIEIAHKQALLYQLGIQLLPNGHSVMLAYSYPFNRAEAGEFERARKALDETNRLTLGLGGVVWKPELPAQKLILEKMDANTRQLMKRIKKMLDPNDIMNPGNWEVA
ncbi:4-cresol dehydrogenase [hydroxylating] flavoprotein subunit [subsurface metagenome]